MVKTCHKRMSNIKQSSSRITWPRINRRSEQSTLESQTVGLTAGLEQQSDQSSSMSRGQPVFESKSGQVSSDFNDRGGKRERQPISFRSCAGDSESNDPDSARIVGQCVDETHGDQAEGGQGKSEVE